MSNRLNSRTKYMQTVLSQEEEEDSGSWESSEQEAPQKPAAPAAGEPKKPAPVAGEPKPEPPAAHADPKPQAAAPKPAVASLLDELDDDDLLSSWDGSEDAFEREPVGGKEVATGKEVKKDGEGGRRLSAFWDSDKMEERVKSKERLSRL